MTTKSTTLIDETSSRGAIFPNQKDEDWLYYNIESLKLTSINKVDSASTVSTKSTCCIHFLNGDLIKSSLPGNSELKKVSTDLNEQFQHITAENHFECTLAQTNETIEIIFEVSENGYQGVGLTINVNDINLDIQRQFITPNKSTQVIHSTININGNSTVRLTDTNKRNNGRLLDFVDSNINGNGQYFTLNESVLSSNSRFEQNVKIMAKHAFARLHGYSINPENGETFYNTHVFHHAEQTESHQLFKSLNLDDALFEYNGKVTVAQNAQQINSYQLNQNIVLNNSATIHSRPQLFIDADDVKCSHGSTTGDINREQLLYLKSRGLDDIEAKRAILFAFLADVLTIEGIDPDRDYLRQIFDEII